MKPTLGWTMLSRAELRQAERLASGEQDTRDEIGFLLIHGDGPGLLGAAIYRAIFEGSMGFTQSPEQGGECLC
jgi:hypothetical protein